MTSSRETQLTDALTAVRNRINDAAAAAGRSPSEVELLPITKFFPATDVAILARLGCHSFGESREQEAARKVADAAAILGVPLHWHMVGLIQRNKAGSIAQWAHAVHSVSTAKVVSALQRHVSAALDDGRRDQPLEVYVQISLDGDTARGGVDIGKPELVDDVCSLVADADGLHLVGLMGIPPMGANPDDAFARLAEEHHRVLESHPKAVALSAGMSDDLEIAVKYGSTCVRVGTAVLGKRPLTSP